MEKVKKTIWALCGGILGYFLGGAYNFHWQFWVCAAAIGIMATLSFHEVRE